MNAIIIWNWYLIFLIQKILDQFLKTWYFTKLDIIAVFNWICIQEDDEKYTVFQTWWDLFEQLMMFFDLKNESSIFQHYINDKLHDFLDVFVITYIDDILIYLFNHMSKIAGRSWIIVMYLLSEHSEMRWLSWHVYKSL